MKNIVRRITSLWMAMTLLILLLGPAQLTAWASEETGGGHHVLGEENPGGAGTGDTEEGSSDTEENTSGGEENTSGGEETTPGGEENTPGGEENVPGGGENVPSGEETPNPDTFPPAEEEGTQLTESATDDETTATDVGPLAEDEGITLVRADGEPLEEGGVVSFGTVLQLPDGYEALLGILDPDGQPITDPDILNVQIQWQRVTMSSNGQNVQSTTSRDSMAGEPEKYLTVSADNGERRHIRARLTVPGHADAFFTELVTVRKQDYDGNFAGPVTFSSVGITNISITSVSGGEYRIAQIGDVTYDDTKAPGLWQSSRSFSSLTPDTAYVFAARIKETSTRKPSPAVLSDPVLTQKRSQAAPTRQLTAAANGITKDSIMLNALSAVTRNGIRIEAEYAISESSSISGQIGDWQASRIFTGLEEGKSYRFFSRYQETAEHHPSPPSAASVAIRTLKAYEGPGVGELTFSRITSNRIEIKAVSKGRYRIAQIGDEVFGPDTTTGTWKSSRDFTDLRAGTTYTFEVMIAATSTMEPSPVSVGVAQTLKGGTQRAPSTPNVATGPLNGKNNQRLLGSSWVQLAPSQRPSGTANSDPGAVIEYGISHQSRPPDHAIAWQSFSAGENIIFYGLRANTSYYFFTRMGETDAYNASPRSTARAVTTAKEGFFTVDGQPLTLTGDILPDGTFHAATNLTADISPLITESGQPVSQLRGPVRYYWYTLSDKDGQPDRTKKPTAWTTFTNSATIRPGGAVTDNWIYVEIRVNGLEGSVFSEPLKVERAPISVLEERVASQIKIGKSSVTLPKIEGVTYTYSRQHNNYGSNIAVPKNRVIKNLQPQENIRINISTTLRTYERATGHVYVRTKGFSQPRAIRPVVIGSKTTTQSITIQTQPGHSYGLSTTSKMAADKITLGPSAFNADGTLTFHRAVERSSGNAVEIRPNTKYHVFSIRDGFETDGRPHTEASKISPARMVRTAKAGIFSNAPEDENIIRNGNRLQLPDSFAPRTVQLDNAQETWSRAQLGKLSYRWRRLDHPNQDPGTGKKLGSKSTYTLKQADVGRYIHLEVKTAGTLGSVEYIHECSGMVATALKVPKQPKLGSVRDTWARVQVLTAQKNRYIEYACVSGPEIPGVDSPAWQREREFSNLSPCQSYTVYARQVSADGSQVSRVSKPLSLTTQRSALGGELIIRSEGSVVSLGDTDSYALGNTWSMDSSTLTNTANGGSGGFYYSWHRIMVDGTVRKTGFSPDYTLTAADMGDDVREIVASTEAFDCVGAAQRRFVNPGAANGGNVGWFSSEIVEATW